MGGPLLAALPEELLLLICSYLDARGLGRLGQVCRRLRGLTARDPLWRRIARGCLNAGFSPLGADLAPGIPVKDRVKVSQNWKHGRCRRETLLKWKRNLMPWMQLDGECLYLSQAEDIRAYRLRPDRAGIQRHPHAIFSGHQEDVCRFVLADSHIVSGGGDGNIILHEMHGSYSVKFSAHEQEVNCVDFRGGIIVSGSRDRSAKVWSLSPSRAGQCLHTIQTEDRVWSIAISPLLSSFVTGTACCGHTSPLRIWDSESSWDSIAPLCGLYPPDEALAQITDGIKAFGECGEPPRHGIKQHKVTEGPGGGGSDPTGRAHAVGFQEHFIVPRAQSLPQTAAEAQVLQRFIVSLWD